MNGVGYRVHWSVGWIIPLALRNRNEASLKIPRLRKCRNKSQIMSTGTLEEDESLQDLEAVLPVRSSLALRPGRSPPAGVPGRHPETHQSGIGQITGGAIVVQQGAQEAPH